MKLLLTCFFAILAASAFADMEIYRVIPNKIIYRLNEPGHIDITVANTSDQTASGLLRISMVTDINDKAKMSEKQISLAANEIKTLTFPFNTNGQRYGRAALTELMVDGKIVAKRSEFFNVINEWWRVASLGNGLSRDEKLRKEIYDYYHIPYMKSEHSFYAGGYLNDICGPFLGYNSHSMLFASMPSFFGEHTPDVPDDVDWYSGTGWYRFNTGKLKKSNAKCKKWGHKLSMFSIAAMTGPAGFELARRDPTYVARTKTGSFVDAGYGSPDPVELSKGITSPCKKWYGVMPDLYDEQVVRFGAEELARGVKYFDWDGVFFDGCGYVAKEWYNYEGIKQPNTSSAPKISARNIKLTREILRKAKPDLFIWYNGANPNSVNSTGNGPFGGGGGGREGKLEMVSDLHSGSLREYQAGQITNPMNSGHNWRSLFEIYLSERDALRLKNWGRPVTDTIVTGCFHPEGFAHDMTKANYDKTRSQWAWCNHLASLVASAQLHFYGSGGAFRPMLQLTTRFSEFFWHEDIEIMRKSYKFFDVDGLREVWWEDAIYELRKPTCTDYIINVVNSPERENAVKTINSCPPAADDIQISCLKWSSADKLEAWAIQPYAIGAKVKEPSVYKLIPKVVEGEVTYELPPFNYYTLVIIRKRA